MARPEELDPVLGQLAAALRSAMERAGLPAADVELERPRNPAHGDWATPVALRLAGQLRRPPLELAERIVAELEPPGEVASVTAAPPGFVNITLAHRYYEGVVRRVLAAGPAYGRRERTDAERIDVEFVSANPTGPLHAGHGRWAAAGDALAEVLTADGHEVTREYYVNDAGEQIRLFGDSVLRAARGEPLTEEHYRGSYIEELARELATTHPELLEDATDPDRVAEVAVALMLDHIRATLRRLGVEFDVWFSERQLHTSGAIDDTVAALTAAGHTYEQDGALFLRTTAFGDDKDRVLIRRDGRPTYFAADCAYLRDKWSRGFDRLIYILGADHHGYVGRMLAAARCLDIPEGAVELRIGQNVNLLRGGEPVKMSKRAGEFVTLDEVIDEVGPDVARYVYLRQSLDVPVDFDLAEVVRRSMDNPVYYVQYAHARIASVIRYADDSGFDAGRPEDADLAVLTHPTELELMRTMAQLPLVVAEAAELRAVQRIAHYAEELAGTFHRFYTECRIVGDDPTVGRARYWLAVAAKQVLANTLGLLRVSAPERM